VFYAASSLLKTLWVMSDTTLCVVQCSLCRCLLDVKHVYPDCLEQSEQSEQFAQAVLSKSVRSCFRWLLWSVVYICMTAWLWRKVPLNIYFWIAIWQYKFCLLLSETFSHAYTQRKCTTRPMMLVYCELCRWVKWSILSRIRETTSSTDSSPPTTSRFNMPLDTL